MLKTPSGITYSPEAQETNILRDTECVGADGVSNPFDPSDSSLYGAGGGCGIHGVLGGDTGGGISSVIPAVGNTTAGTDGSFYGAGGGSGGASNSARWAYGGGGYQGIAIFKYE